MDESKGIRKLQCPYCGKGDKVRWSIMNDAWACDNCGKYFFTIGYASPAGVAPRSIADEDKQTRRRNPFSRLGPRLHDGYYLFRGEVVFYSDDDISRVLSGRVFKVDEEKALNFEGMCNIAANNFLELGMLRLHTPVDVRQEERGTYFLYVPIPDRPRILDLIQGGTLISLKPSGFTEFEVIETGQRLTMEDLVGSLDRLVDIEKEYKPLREKLERQEISRKEFETQKEALAGQLGQSKFYITQLGSVDMFITRNKTWLGKLGIRGQS